MKKTFNEFKAFISKGNIIDMAIGVIIGTAFGKIVTSLVNDLIMPLIGVSMGGINFSELSLFIRDAEIKYGALVQNIIDFLIIAVCMFIVVKIIAALHRKKEEEEAPAPAKSEEVLLLEEIRDLMKEGK